MQKEFLKKRKDFIVQFDRMMFYFLQNRDSGQKFVRIPRAIVGGGKMTHKISEDILRC